MSQNKFQIDRLVQFYETDAMGIVHHANYVLMMEEARLHFLRMFYGDQHEGNILGEINYPLLSCHVDYKKSLRFNDQVTIKYQARVEGVKLVFDYQFVMKSFSKPLASGKTVHVAFDMKAQRATKLPEELLQFLNDNQ